jgi:hypothetical protein
MGWGMGWGMGRKEEMEWEMVSGGKVGEGCR